VSAAYHYSFFLLFEFTKIKATVVPALCRHVNGRQYSGLWAADSSKTQADCGLKRKKREKALIDMFGATCDLELPVLIAGKNRTKLSDSKSYISSQVTCI